MSAGQPLVVQTGSLADPPVPLRICSLNLVFSQSLCIYVCILSNRVAPCGTPKRSKEYSWSSLNKNIFDLHCLHESSPFFTRDHRSKKTKKKRPKEPGPFQMDTGGTVFPGFTTRVPSR